MTDTAPRDSQDPADLLRAAVTAAQAGKEPPAAQPTPPATSGTMPDSVPCKAEASGLRHLGLTLTAVRQGWPALAAEIVLAAGLGFGAARFVPAPESRAGQAEQRWSEAAAGLQQSHDDLTRVMADLRTLKLSVETMKGERDRARVDVTGKQAQLSDRLERAAAESGARIGKLAEQLDRIEKAERDPARLQAWTERLDRIEKQAQLVADKVTAAKPAAVSAAPLTDTVTQTGSLAEAKPAKPDASKLLEPDPRKVPLEGYVLRDVDDGVALVEARNGRMIEAQPGRNLSPGNRVEAIERRGRQWVVVTTKGFIGERWP